MDETLFLKLVSMELVGQKAFRPTVLDLVAGEAVPMPILYPLA
jgi:hypothetical protein